MTGADGKVQCITRSQAEGVLVGKLRCQAEMQVNYRKDQPALRPETRE